jgi:polysaccharide biosynthesis protein PslG
MPLRSSTRILGRSGPTAMLVIALLAGGVVPAAHADAGRPARFGINLGMDTSADGGTTALAAGLGVDGARIEPWWSGIEKTSGELVMPAKYTLAFDRMRAAGIRPLIVLDYTNPNHDDGRAPTSPEAVAAFARYAAFVATRFGDGAVGFEVWNEWPNTVDPSDRDPERYIALTRAAASAIHAAAPGSTVVGPAMSLLGADGLHPWLREWLDDGGPSTVDAVSVHAYSGTRPPESTIDPGMRDLRRALIAQDRNVPVWFTEAGWRVGTAATRGVTSDAQASLLVREAVLAARYRATKVYPFRIADAPSAPTGYGLFRSSASGAPSRPAAGAYRTLVSTVGGLPYAGVDRDGSGGVWIVRFSNGRRTVRVVWSTSAKTQAAVPVEGTTTRSTRDGVATAVTVRDGVAEVDARTTPCYLVTTT